MNSNDQYKDILIHMHDGLYFTDTRRVITFWNKAAEKISGYSAEEVIGTSCADEILMHVDVHGNNLCRKLCPLAASMKDGKTREADVFLHHKNGHRVPVFVRVSPLKDKDGEIVGGIELFTDMTHEKVNASRIEELEKLAMMDKLTKLANRNHIEKDLTIRFDEMRRYKVPFGLLFIDIDHFKRVNDTYGHDVGDKVLKLVANTFVSNSRPFDLYGRWGGEEFIGIIRNIKRENLISMADRLRLLVQNTWLNHESEKLTVTVSIGATMVDLNDNVETLIKRADSLLYKSKESGRNQVSFG